MRSQTSLCRIRSRFVTAPRALAFACLLSAVILAPCPAYASTEEVDQGIQESLVAAAVDDEAAIADAVEPTTDDGSLAVLVPTNEGTEVSSLATDLAPVDDTTADDGASSDAAADDSTSDDATADEAAEAEEEPTGGAQVVELGNEGHTENTEDGDNAIQLAVNKALAYASDADEGAKPESMTIAVYDGTYKGGLNISLKRAITKDGSTTQTSYQLPDNFLLKIRHESLRDAADDDLTNAAPGAILAGSITIEDIRVELSGIFLGKGNDVKVGKGSVKDASKTVPTFVYNGTTDPDGASFTLTEVVDSTIKGGSGDDTLTVTYSRGDLAAFTDAKATIAGGAGNDTITVKGSGSDGGYRANVSGGAGDDLITLDTSLCNFANTKASAAASVSVKGDEGMDRVHLTGSLAKISDKVPANITGDRTALTIVGDLNDKKESTGDLKLTFADIEAYTDELDNKSEVELAVNETKSLVYAETLKSFTNYVLAGETLNSVEFLDTKTDLFLSTLKVAARVISRLVAPTLNVFNETKSAGAGISSNKGQRIGLPEGMDAATFAKTYATDGFVGIRARNILLREGDSDEYESKATFKVPEKLTAALDGQSAIDLATWNFTVNAHLVLDAGAKLEASEAVIIEAVSTQVKGFLPTTIPYVKFNSFTLKWGTARVDIHGAIAANVGVDISSAGTIKIECENDKVPIPFAVAYAALDAGTYLDGATITTDGSVTVRSTTEASLTSITSSNISPLMAAINIGLVYAEADVKNSTITAKGDVRILGTSSLSQTAKATYDGTSSSTGGFVTVNIADHEALATVGKGTTIEAGGAVFAEAGATQCASATATSGKSVGSSEDNDDEDSNGSSSVKPTDKVDTSDRTAKWADLDFGSINDVVKSILGKVTDDASTANQITGKIGAGLDRAKESTETGNVSIEDVDENELEEVADDGAAPAAPAGTLRAANAANAAPDAVAAAPADASDDADAPAPAAPDAADDDAAPAVTDVFDAATSATSGKVSQAKVSKTHVVGAVAVSVVNNTADAHVANGATITSGGRLAVTSTASAAATTTADASAAIKDASTSNPTNADGQITTSAQQKKLGTEKYNKTFNIVTGTYGVPGDANTTIYVETNKGAFSATGSTINIEGGSKITNVGGKVDQEKAASRLDKSKLVVSGGTTTIEDATVTIDTGKDGTLTWKAGEENGQHYVEIFNKNSTTSTDGDSTTDYKGGSVRVYGGTLTIQNGVKVTLEHATMTIANGMLYIEYGYSEKAPEGVTVTDSDDGKTHTLTGDFEFKSTAGGEVSFAVDHLVTIEKAKATATKIYVHSITVKSPLTTKIERWGGTIDTNEESGVTPASVEASKIKDDAAALKLTVDVDLAREADAHVTFTGDTKNTDRKSAEGRLSLGEVKTTTAEDGTVSTDKTMRLVNGGTVSLGTEAKLTLPASATYRIINGNKSSVRDESDGKASFYTTYTAAAGKTLTVYVDFTEDYSLALNGDYKGKIAFNKLTWTPKAADGATEVESLQGSYVLSDAKVTLTDALLKLTKGRLAISGGSIKIADADTDGNGGTWTITGSSLAFTMGGATLSLSGEGAKMTVDGGSIKLEPNAENTEQTALGAAVAVSIFNSRSEAYVDKGATVRSGGLEVRAKTTSANGATNAHAGFTNAEKVVAGAIAVMVSNIETLADVREGADVTLTGGPLIVTADAVTSLKVVADAPISTKGESGTGVGAGIAVEVSGIETRAQVADETVETTGDLSTVSVKATHRMPEFSEYPNQVKGSAGASGGTAVTPALGLYVGGSSTTASLGRGEALTATGDVDIEAYNEIEREVEGDAAASGSDVGIGGSFAIAVLNDATTARLMRSVRGGKVNVKATGIQRTKTGTSSSAKGAEPKKESDDTSSDSGDSSGGDGDDDAGGDQGQDADDAGDAAPTADDQADAIIAGGKKLGTISRSNCLTEDQIEALTADRQKAETSEGSVSVAAAFSLNIVKNIVVAEIGDGLDIVSTAGNVAVETVRDTDASASANGSTTISKVGVGVAVAINVVNTKATARLGLSTVRSAGDLIVRASQLDDSEDDAADKDTRDLFVDCMKQLADDLLASVTQETGLQGIAALIHGTIGDKLEARWANIEKTIENHKNEVVTAVVKNVMNMVMSRFASNVQFDWKKDLKADAIKIVESISKDVCADLFDTGKLKSYITGNMGEIVKIANNTINRSLNDVRRAFFGFLCKAFGEGEDAPASTYTTQAIAGAGASDVGVAGSVAIAVVHADNIAIIAERTERLATDDLVCTGVATIASESAETFDTVATAAVTDANTADKNDDADEKDDAATATATKADGSGTDAHAAAAPAANTGTPSDADAAKGVGVGAGFAMVYAKLDSVAELGAKRTLSADAIDVHAASNNTVGTYSVAGTDPLKDTNEDAKKVALDASAALNILDATTKAAICRDAHITAKGTGAAKPPVREDKPYVLLVVADAESHTLAKASGFATGDSTAVGAAVSVNVVNTDTAASLDGTALARGSVGVDVQEVSTDDAVATATAIGSDLQRYFSKFANATDTLETWANKLANGKVALKDPSKKKGDNKTADTIADKLNDHANENEHADGSAADSDPAPAATGAALSTNVLASQHVTTEEAAPTADATSAVTDATNQTADPTDAAADASSKKVLVAAAVSANIVGHRVQALVTGKVTTQDSDADVDAKATNKANYRSYATGASATGKGAVAAIGAAVALGVNANQAVARLDGSVTAHGGTNVSATLTQNMDGVYAGLLGAQSIAGAASGSGSKATVAGAVSVLVAKGKTEAIVGEKSSLAADGDVSITAYDKSKLAVRAGSLSASGGSAVGVGASFALIYGRDAVRALVGDGATVTARDLAVRAERAMVTFTDYAIGKDWSTLFGVEPSVKKDDQDDDEIEAAKTQPLITLTEVVEGEGDKQKTSYKVSLNVGTDTVLGAIDLLNFLSSTNYYAEAISGALSGSKGATVSVAGSFAFVFGGTTVEALIGKGAHIPAARNVSVTAVSGTNVRIITGSLSASGAKVGVGASVAVYQDTRTTHAAIGQDVLADQVSGTVTVSARGSQTDKDWSGAETDAAAPYQSSNILVIAVAPAVSTGTVAVGATVPVIVTKDVFLAEIADNAAIAAKGDVVVSAQTSAKLLPIALAVAVSTGSVGVGGNVLVLVDQTQTKAAIGSAATVISTEGSVRVSARSDEFLVVVLPSVGASSKVGVAGTIAALISRSLTEASVGQDATITARQNLAVTADSEAFMVAVSVAASGSGTAAVGAVVNVFVFDRDVLAQVGTGARLTSHKGDVIVRATGKDYAVVVALGAAGAGSAAVGGTVPVVVSTNRVRALVDASTEALANPGSKGSEQATTITAGTGSIAIIADLESKNYIAGGGFAGSGTAAVGATVLTTVMQNRVQGLVGHDAILSAAGNGAGIALPSDSTGRRRRGIVVAADLRATTDEVAISGSGAGSVAVSGVVVTGVFQDLVHAIIYGGGSTNANSDNDAEGDLATLAHAESSLLLVGGSLSGAGAVGAGATVLTLVYDREVIASVNVQKPGEVKAHSIEVLAGSTDAKDVSDKVKLFAVSISGSGTVAVGAGASVVYLDGRTTAELGGTVSATGDIKVAARSGMSLINASSGVAGSGTASVTGVLLVTYFRNTTLSQIAAASKVTAGGAVSVMAESAEWTNVDALGITGSGVAAVSGTVATVFTRVSTRALVGERATVTAASLTIAANDDFDLLGIAGTAAIGAYAGVGVTALVGVSTNTIEALIAQSATVTCTGDVTVTATGNRDVQIYLATGAGGIAGVGANVLVFVAGGKINQDSADALKGDGKGATYFDAGRAQTDLRETLVGSKGAVGAGTSAGKAVAAKLDSTDLSADLAGDGARMSDTKVASDGDFDVTGDFGMAKDADYTVNGQSAVPNKGSYSSGDLHEVTSIVKDSSADLGDDSVPVISGNDIVRASIAAKATVSATNITVEATDTLTIDIMAVTISGGVAGVAPSIVAGITFANAAAYVDQGATLTATGDVRIVAHTGSKVVSPEGDANEQARNKAFKSLVGNDADEAAGSMVVDGKQYSIFTARGVRAVSGAGGVGGVGVGVAISLLTLDSNAYAYLAGNVTKAASLTVKATTSFPLVASATFGFGAGGVGVSFAGSFAVARGTSYAAIVGNASVKDITGSVAVATDTTFNASTFCAAIAGGLVSVNGAVAVTDDLMHVYTFVGRPVTLDVTGKLSVRATGIVQGNAIILGATAGYAAVGANVGVVNVRPTILTFVGLTPRVNGRVTSDLAGSAGQAGPICRMGELNIENDFVTSGNATLLGVAVGAGTAVGNVLVVNNNTLARSGIFSKDLEVSGAATVISALSDAAKAGLVSASAGIYAAGVNTFVANLTSDNAALVDASSTSTLRFGSLAVRARAADNPNITSAVAAGVGATMGAIAASVNVGVANNATINNAEVIGNGRVWVRGALVIVADGRATATAFMDPGIANVSGASVAANLVFANVTAQQVARFAAWELFAGSLSVASNLNLPSENRAFGATARTGSNGGANVSILGIGVSVAKAKMDATARAIVEKAQINTEAAGKAGGVSIAVQAVSNATADVIEPTVNASLFRLGVIVTRADAAGTFETVLSGHGTLGSTTVRTSYGSLAKATTGPTGGVAAGLTQAGANIATSQVTTDAKATASVEGGPLNVKGDLSVVATADPVMAHAEGRTYKVSVSGLRVAVNDVSSQLKATQAAMLNVGGGSTSSGSSSGDLVVSGAVKVRSDLGAYREGAQSTAIVGSSAGGDKSLSISLVGVTSNKADSKSETTNTATVTGTNTAKSQAFPKVSLGSLEVIARTHGESLAQAKTSLTAGLVTLGGLKANASATDAAHATISELGLDVTGNVDVSGTVETSVNSLAQSPGAISVSGGNVAESYTYLGSSAAPVSASATIGDGVTITAGGNVSVDAKGTGSTQGKLAADKNFALLSGKIDARLKSTSYLTAAVDVASKAAIKAGGYISVTSDTKLTSTSDARSSTIGMVVSSGTTHAYADAHETAAVTVGEGASFEAVGNITVGSLGNVEQDAKTVAGSAGGFVDKATLTSENYLTRSVATRLGRNVRLASEHGDISVTACAGDNDSLVNEASISGGGFAAYTHALATTKIVSGATVDVGDGSTIDATLGTVDIHADSSLCNFYNRCSVDASGVGTEPNAKTSTTLELTSATTVGAKSGSKTTITANDLVIDSRVSRLQFIDSTYAHGKALGANVDAKSEDWATVKVSTTVENALLTGLSSVSVTATAQPEVPGDSSASANKNVYVRAYASIDAIGDADADAFLRKSAFTTAVRLCTSKVITGDATIASTNRLSYVPSADGHKIFLASLDKHTEKHDDQVKATVDLCPDNQYVIGGGAAGIVADIAEGSARPSVRFAGLDQAPHGWALTGDTVRLSGLQNDYRGSLTVTTYSKGTQKYVDVPRSQVCSQVSTPFVRVVNHTDWGILLPQISTINQSSLSLAPLVNGAVMDGVSTSEGTSDVICESHASGDVTVGGVIYNPEGTVSFIWTDPDKPGSLYAVNEWVRSAETSEQIPTIWAHSFIVDGAKEAGAISSVGDARIGVALCWDDEEPQMFVDVQDGATLGVTDVRFADMGRGSTGARSAIGIENVHAKDWVDVVIYPAATYEHAVANALVPLPTPGEVIYAEESVDLGWNVTLSAKDLAKYLVDVDAQSRRTYLLPDGTTIITDAEGNVLFISHDAMTFDLSKYVLTTDEQGHLVASTDDGIYVDLSDGTITIEPEHSISQLGGWVKGSSFAEIFALIESGELKPVTYVDGEEVPLAFAGKGVFPHWLSNELMISGYLLAPEGFDFMGAIQHNYDFTKHPVFFLADVDERGRSLMELGVVKNYRVPSGCAEGNVTLDAFIREAERICHGTVATLSQQNGDWRLVLEGVGDRPLLNMVGPLTGVQFTKTSYPSSVVLPHYRRMGNAFDVEGYLMTEEDVFIHPDGSFSFINGKRRAWLDPRGEFNSAFISISSEGGLNINNGVTVKGAQYVWFELLTPDVARLLDGTYYVKTTSSNGSAKWVKATSVSTKTHTETVDATTDTYAVDEDGNIQYEQGTKTLEVAVTTVKSASGLALTVTTYTDIETGEVILIQHELPNGTMVNSNGVVVRDSDSDPFKENSGSTYVVDNLEAKRVAITFADFAKGADLVGAADSARMASQYGATPSAVGATIVEEPRALSIKAEYIEFLAVYRRNSVDNSVTVSPMAAGGPLTVIYDGVGGGDSEIEKDTWISVVGDIDVGDTDVPAGRTYHWDATGTITFGIITMGDGSRFELFGQKGVRGGSISGGANAVVVLQSTQGEVSFDHIAVGEGSTVTLTAAGPIRGWVSGPAVPKVTITDPTVASDARMLTFDQVGGTWQGHTDTLWYLGQVGDIITLPTPTRAGYVFVHWLGSIYYGGQRYTISDNHHFTAVWHAVTAPQEGEGEVPAACASAAAWTLPATGDTATPGLALVAAGLVLVVGGLATRRRRAA